MAFIDENVPRKPAPAVAVVGDVHGHLQLALCMAARWQRHLNLRFEAVLLAGDVGTFTDPAQLDGATLAHAKNNPCELEFLRQWRRTRRPHGWPVSSTRGKRRTRGSAYLAPW